MVNPPAGKFVTDGWVTAAPETNEKTCEGASRALEYPTEAVGAGGGLLGGIVILPARLRAESAGLKSTARS
jgi:hypothetical protein